MCSSRISQGKVGQSYLSVDNYKHRALILELAHFRKALDFLRF